MHSSYVQFPANFCTGVSTNWSGCQYGLVIGNLNLVFSHNVGRVMLVPIFPHIYIVVVQNFKMDILAYVIVACEVLSLCQRITCTQDMKYGFWVLFTHTTEVIIGVFEDMLFVIFSKQCQFLGPTYIALCMRV